MIAIPSYGRSKECKAKTITTLEKNMIPKDRITIYVVAEQVEEYKKELPDYRIVTGVKGIVPQRQYILEQYPTGTNLVYMDDDLEHIDLSMTSYPDLMSFINDAFKQSKEKGAYLWGVYAVYNPFFRKDREDVSTCLNFCVGCFYGIITRPNNRKLDITISVQGNKEDVERSIRYFIEDGVVLRFNKIAPKTKYFGAGGIGLLKERLAEIDREVDELQKAFPDYGRKWHRKNGIAEFRLMKKISMNTCFPLSVHSSVPSYTRQTRWEYDTPNT